MVTLILVGIGLPALVASLLVGAQLGLAALIGKYRRWKQPSPAIRRESLLQRLRAHPCWEDQGSDENRLKRVKKAKALAYALPLGFPLMAVNRVAWQHFAAWGWLGLKPEEHPYTILPTLLLCTSLPMLFFGALLTANAQTAEEALNIPATKPPAPVPVFWPARS